MPDRLINHTLCTEEKTEEFNQIYEAHMNTFIYLIQDQGATENTGIIIQMNKKGTNANTTKKKYVILVFYVHTDDKPPYGMLLCS